MLSSIPKLNKTDKEIILLQKKTSVMYFTTVQSLRVLFLLLRVSYLLT